jgi:hypothetical protein
MPTQAEKDAYAAQYYGVKESTVEQRANEYAKDCGVWQRKFKSANNRGVPDRIYITPSGVVFFIEYKKPGKSARKQQKLVIDEMRDDYNAKVFVTDDYDEAVSIINDMVAFGEH